MGRIIEKIKVYNLGDILKVDENLIPKDEIRSIELDALVDTGATFVCLPRKEIEKLGLRYHNTTKIRTANGQATRRIFIGAEVELKGRSIEMPIMENNEDTPPLIGYLLLEALDYVIDPQKQQLIPNPTHDGKWIADMYYCLLIGILPNISERNIYVKKLSHKDTKYALRL